ncbi:carbohydrate sulfotransferase 11-like isoform X2 [Oculina patagonica]
MKPKIIILTVAFLSVYIFLSYWSSKSTQTQVTLPQIKSVSEELKEKPTAAQMSPEERQKARKQQLRDYCRTHTYNKNQGTEKLHRIAVDDELKLIYGVIPKVATTTWKTVFRSARGIRGGMSRWILWKRFSNYTEEERSKRLQTYFKFVFVREPLQRLLSAYKNKFIQKPRASNDIRRVIVQAFRPQDFEPEGENFVSFSEFIQYFSNNISRDRHWRQYEKLSHPCVINYDFIGHFETMEEDGPLVLKMAGIADRVTFPPIHKSTGTDEVLEYYSQVPPEYITRIGELYRSDFEMFGYEYLGPVKKLLNQSSKG